MNLGPKNDYVNNLYIFPDPATSIESELVSHLPHKLFIRQTYFKGPQIIKISEE